MFMMRITVFTDRYPYLGPAIWVLTVEYLIIQVIAAAAWRPIGYSWLHNAISDLGNTACGQFGSRYVCSPLHPLMNAAFIALGVFMSVGSLLIYQEFRERKDTLIGFSFMGLAGVGTALVGIFPENVSPVAHTLGASLPFILGNVSLVVLGFALFNDSKILRWYTVLSGVIALVAFGFFITSHYVGLGLGGIERVVAYPQTFWLIFFGIYMSHNEYVKRRSNRTKVS
jgi:hypothetical membrane protein